MSYIIYIYLISWSKIDQVADEGKNETLEDFEMFNEMFQRQPVNIIAYSVMSAGKK